MRIKALALASLLLAACARQAAEVEDFSKKTRFPDDEGIVTAIDFEQVQIDGSRTHPIRSDIQSFSTYTGKVTPLLAWQEKYVHVGLDAQKRAIWIAGIGVVNDARTPPVVLYLNGILVKVDSQNRAIFKDGTVLRLGQGIARPQSTKLLKATIDPGSDLVIEFVEQ